MADHDVVSIEKRLASRMRLGVGTVYVQIAAEVVREAVEAEREACAGEAERTWKCNLCNEPCPGCVKNEAGRDIATRIRARSTNASHLS